MNDERGFTLPAVLCLITVGLLLAMAAFTAAQGGTATSGDSRDDKQAYAAAEAGLNWYLSRLVYDNAFWAKCTDVAGPSAPVNNPTDTTRRWRTVPDSTAEYNVELIPANGATACSTATPNATMIDATTRTFKVRVNGRFNGDRASLVATFRRARFLDYVYLTEYETTDPLNYPTDPASQIQAQACKDKLRPQRELLGADYCNEIQFGSSDFIKGPLHSNDSLLICGATFGRSGADAIETSAPSPGWKKAGSGCANPNFVGPLGVGAGTVSMPDTNEEIAANALPTWSFRGATQVTLRGDLNPPKVEINNAGLNNGAKTSLDWPTNGLIYVDTGAAGCSSTLNPQRVPTYTGSGAESAGCANVRVDGVYSKDITIASRKDVIVDGDVTMRTGSNAVAGLIADRFVRTYHPVTYNSSTSTRCTNTGDWATTDDLTIQAAILAVNNSFTVDNYACGGDLGTLTVTGGIAQSYRGAVGTVGSPGTGYAKDYTYDDRFAYRNPPFFLEPASATWRVVRTAEDLPASQTG